jgi:hypothetical protein
MSGVPPDYVMSDYRMTVRFDCFSLQGAEAYAIERLTVGFLSSWFFDKFEKPWTIDGVNDITPPLRCC